MATTPERIEKAHHNQGRKPVNKLQVPIGQVFGFLTVLREAPSKKWMTMVECRCVCGGIVIKRLQQQCEEAGVSLDTVQHRIKRGWPEERWFDPVKRRKF